MVHNPSKRLRKLVAADTANGVTQADIATILGISVNTLKVHYKQELATARIAQYRSLTGRHYEVGMDREANEAVSKGCREFILERLHGLVRKDVTSIDLNVLSGMTDQELDARIADRERALAKLDPPSPSQVVSNNDKE